MRKVIILSPADVEYVFRIAKQISDPRSLKGDFSRALRQIIKEHKEKCS